MTITPIIDDTKFVGSDNGLAVPLRRTSTAAFALRITNLDHADPPTPYQPGGVPREATFNNNVLAITAVPKMPKITVACEAIGFDPAASKIVWRLQTLYVVGRYKKMSGGATPHYRSRVLSVGDTWTGESGAARFVLFDNDANVTYDNNSDRVAGGDAILTVAAKPAGSDAWLQDYVHLRITGTNPTTSIVRKYVHDALAQRNTNIECMADAVFAWENAMMQFDPRVRTNERYAGVTFAWPRDPAKFPAVAFDFGIGIGQFTHPGQETVGICWDWRDNLDAGINELLDDLRGTFSPQQSFAKWATNAWTMYNTGRPGASAYATRLANSPDGRKIDTGLPPAGFDRNSQTAHVVGRPPPAAPARSWPVPVPAPAPAASLQVVAAANAIVTAVGDKVSDPHLLAWMWPKIESEVVDHGGHDDTPAFPGLHESGLTDSLAHLDRARRRQATDAAFVHLWGRAQAAVPAARRGKRTAPKRTGGGRGRARTKGGVAGAPAGPTISAVSGFPNLFGPTPSDVSAEFNSLIPIVRKNVDGGVGGWVGVRQRMFDHFGAPGNSAAAIPRINAYYGRLMPANFPPTPTSTKGCDTPVHPVLKAKLDRAASLLQSKDLAAALKFGEIGGFDIRNNVNSPTELSNHSFGWAVDLDAELNPNIKKTHLPLAVIAGLTGLYLYGPVSQALRAPRPFDACLPDATLFTDASAALVDAFRTLANLKTAADAAITRATGRTLTPAQLDDAFTAAAQGEGAVRQALAGAGLSSAQAAAASKWLFVAIGLFATKQSVKRPQVLGNAGTVARYGFCNLAPALIAALIASDGGRLNWLGAARSTKDFMHFDLLPDDQPKLVG